MLGGKGKPNHPCPFCAFKKSGKPGGDIGCWIQSTHFQLELEQNICESSCSLWRKQYLQWSVRLPLFSEAQHRKCFLPSGTFWINRVITRNNQIWKGIWFQLNGFLEIPNFRLGFKKKQLLHWSPILFPILWSPESSDAALKHSPKGNKKHLDLLEFHSDSPGKCDHKKLKNPNLGKGDNMSQQINSQWIWGEELFKMNSQLLGIIGHLYGG